MGSAPERVTSRPRGASRRVHLARQTPGSCSGRPSVRQEGPQAVRREGPRPPALPSSQPIWIRRERDAPYPTHRPLIPDASIMCRVTRISGPMSVTGTITSTQGEEIGSPYEVGKSGLQSFPSREGTHHVRHSTRACAGVRASGSPGRSPRAGEGARACSLPSVDGETPPGWPPLWASASTLRRLPQPRRSRTPVPWALAGASDSKQFGAVHD